MKRQIMITLFVTVWLFAACSSDKNKNAESLPNNLTLGPDVGAEGGPCNADETCSAGLICSSETKLCIKGPQAGEEGGACLADGTCSAGLICISETRLCIKGPQAGEEGGACLADGTCGAGLICSSETKLCIKGPAAGEEGGACLADGTCGAGLICSSETKLCIKGIVLIHGRTFNELSLKPCPDGMVLIKGGTFNMGTDDPDPILANAKPVHSVTLSKDFCMDEHEFTNRDKGMSVFAGFTWPPVYGDSNFTHDNQPLINVNWNEAKAICEKQGKRLPTEAEWEYAAKGGANEYEYGTSDGSLTDNNACWKKTKTCDVMSYQPNIFGLYDMSGNVWEWVSDWYGDYKSTAVTDPTGPLSGTYRVFRGGSWGSVNPGFLRAAIRYYDYPGLRRYGIGFRCVAAPQDSKK